MEDTVFALVAIGAGALFCYVGYRAFRLVVALWGAFVGFGLGAGLVASLGDERFLSTGTGWLVGVALAVILAALTYFAYEAAVVVAMGSIGFALGTSLMVALDLEWTWVIILAGLVFGGLLALVALAAELPRLLLIVLSAMGGASAITTGLMLLTGAIDTAEFSDATLSRRAADGSGWYIVYLLLLVSGAIAQFRGADNTRRSMRQSW